MVYIAFNRRTMLLAIVSMLASMSGVILVFKSASVVRMLAFVLRSFVDTHCSGLNMGCGHNSAVGLNPLLCGPGHRHEQCLQAWVAQ